MGKTGWMVAGLLFLAVGVGSLFLEGISYVTNETVLDVGPLQVTAEREERVSIPLWISVVLIAAGTGGLLLAAGRGSTR